MYYYWGPTSIYCPLSYSYRPVYLSIYPSFYLSIYNYVLTHINIQVAPFGTWAITTLDCLYYNTHYCIIKKNNLLAPTALCLFDFYVSMHLMHFYHFNPNVSYSLLIKITVYLIGKGLSHPNNYTLVTSICVTQYLFALFLTCITQYLYVLFL